MVSKADKNWWAFSIDSESRASHPVFTGDMAVNPPLSDGRRLLDYHCYLGLDKLLHCQVPSSMIPDERIFIITHQMFELTFKQMIFDLAVIASTIANLMLVQGGSRELLRASQDQDSWHPALTASARLEFSAKEVIPILSRYLGKGRDKGETFSSIEFGGFRTHLAPASGFQTAQFRLIQRALGKTNLLRIRIFPGEEYWRNYANKEDGLIRVVDPLVLGKDASVVFPRKKNSPLALVADLDNLVHKLLARFQDLADATPQDQMLDEIREYHVAKIGEEFSRFLTRRRKVQMRMNALPKDAAERDAKAVDILMRDLKREIRRENLRRKSFNAARAGFLNLSRVAPRSPLEEVIANLISTDDSLHSPTKAESFLSLHLKLAGERISDLERDAERRGEAAPFSGTGGGGIPYLHYMSKYLIPLFPALVACRQLNGQSAMMIDPSFD